MTRSDELLIARLRAESQGLFPERMRDGHAYHSTAFALDKAADRIEALTRSNDEPTEAMIEAGLSVMHRRMSDPHEAEGWLVAAIYKAMSAIKDRGVVP